MKINEISKLIVYHGSKTEFTDFHDNFSAIGNQEYGSGFYFTDDKDVASGYAYPNGYLYTVELNLTKPFIIDAEHGQNINDFELTARQAEKIISMQPNIYDANESPLVDWIDNNGKKFTYQHIKEVVSDNNSIATIERDFFNNMESLFRKIVNKVTKHDSIMIKFAESTNYVAWFPSQIKIVSKIQLHK